VAADRVPFGLVEAPVSHPDLTANVVGEDEMVLVAPPGHPLARRRDVDALDLASVPLLRREAGSGTRALVDAALLAAGVNPPTQMQLGSPEALKQAVLASVGVAWLPNFSISRELASRDLVRVRVRDLSVRRTLSAIHRHDTPPPPLGALLLDLVRAASQELAG
jgi:DNA-binding transcriptional LysR family regulator